MFVRLLVCVGLLTLPCFGLVGCGDEDPQIVKEVAQLVETVPASGEQAADALPVVLYFDKEPLAVTVNGIAARVEGNRAFWCFPRNPLPEGNELFHIEWTNPDGSQNVGTSIRLMVMADVAKLVRTLPANGEDAAADLPVVLYFDKAPLAVTVNGTAARVQGNRAFWCFPRNPLPEGNELFHIEWTNPDGSQNVGTHIELTVFNVHFEPPELTWPSVNDGDADVDPDPLNMGDLRFYFNEPIIGVEAKLLTGDGKDLGWQAIWDDQSVTFLPDANAKLLENGTRYIVQMVVAEPWVYSEIACACMDCSRYKNPEWTIGFVTAEK